MPNALGFPPKGGAFGRVLESVTSLGDQGRDGTAIESARGLGWVAAAGPSVGVVVPLAGAAVHPEELHQIMRDVRITDAEPVAAMGFVGDRLSDFVDLGNFRPVGRFVDAMVHGLVFEAGEATGVAPDAVLGVVRLAVLGFVAVLAVRMMECLVRSAGVPTGSSFTAFYPLVLAAAVVANGSLAGLFAFPQTAAGSAMLVLGIALMTARDRDMRERSVRWHECVVMALLGAVAASFYDLAYVAPAAAAAFVAAGAIAAGHGLREIARTAALRRLAAVCGGFAVVFVPTRIEIARRCTGIDCYAASDASFSAEAVGAT